MATKEKLRPKTKTKTKVKKKNTDKLSDADIVERNTKIKIANKSSTIKIP
jgi:hypothetical protein